MIHPNADRKKITYNRLGGRMSYKNLYILILMTVFATTLATPIFYLNDSAKIALSYWLKILALEKLCLSIMILRINLFTVIGFCVYSCDILFTIIWQSNILLLVTDRGNGYYGSAPGMLSIWCVCVGWSSIIYLCALSLSTMWRI